jgi:hypothetical protein
MTHDHHQPSGVSVDLPEIIDWLSSKRSTLWSTWAIDDDKGKEQAARWFYKELVSLMNHTASKMHQPTGG